MTIQRWEYCEVDFDGRWSNVYFYDEAGAYIDEPKKHPRLGVALAHLGHDGWEIISSWWRSKDQVTYILKRPMQGEWTSAMRKAAQEAHIKSNKTRVSFKEWDWGSDVPQ